MGARINFAFIVIILVMAIVQAGFSFFVDISKSKERARAVTDPAIKYVNAELETTIKQNFTLAQQIAANPDFQKAFAAKDRAGVAAAIKAAFDRAGFGGYGTIVLEGSSLIFYSSDSPGKANYRTEQVNDPFCLRVFRSSDVQYAVCSLSNTGTMCLETGYPLRSAPKAGILCIGTPFASELLHGMEQKIKLSNDNLKDLGLAFDVVGRGITAYSNDLIKSSYLSNLNRGTQTIKDSIESDGRLWKAASPMLAPDGKPIACVIVSAPLQNPFNPMLMVGIFLSAAAAFLLSLVFGAGISKRFDQSMRFLKQRAKDLASNRQDLPSLAGVSGDWLDLAEMMDTAMASPRTVVQNLKVQVAKQDEEIKEKQRQVDAINYQLEQSNRQLTTHNRQSLEVSAQVSNANKQAIQIQQKLEAVLQCTSEGFLLLDPYGSVLAANPKFLHWVGLQEREVAGRICFDLVRKPGDPPSQGMNFAHVGSGPEDLINQFYPEGVVHSFSQEKHVEVLVHLQPIVNEEGLIEGYLMVLRDKSLHAEVARLRKEIVTMLGDDVRAPLATAELRWKTVMSGNLQGVNPGVAQNLIEMHKIYEQMLGVVESYLMMYGGFVPMPPEQVQREQVSVTRLIGECLERVSQKARAQQIMLDYKTVTGLPTTGINKEIVADIIIQLLEKMISVTAPGGRVRAETTVKGKEIRLIISSSGPALQQLEIEEMFVGFVDGRHTEDTYQTRLSMYLARNNAERLGGRIWAESEAGRGTAIFLTLPVH